MMKKTRVHTLNPAAWRDAPRDEDHARKAFPVRADFIRHLRATNRPTSKDLRILRAVKRLSGDLLVGPRLDPAATPLPEDGASRPSRSRTWR